MDNRNILRGYNNIVVSEEEIKKYEAPGLKDEVLSKMIKRAEIVYIKANMEEAFERVEEQFENGEKVNCIFWEDTYMVRGFQSACGGWAAPAGANWTVWPTRTGIVLTNKGIFAIAANKAYSALKIKNFRFNDIDYIESKSMNKKLTAFIIKPINGEEVKLEIRSGNNHIKFIDLIKKNNIKLDIRITKGGIKEKIQTIIAAIALIILVAAGLMRAYLQFTNKK